MKVAIMQPTYMPWAGYLRLIAKADRFVYLDDAQYERGTWHQRNRVLANGHAHWLTVPVRRVSLGDSILDVQTDDAAPWRRKHAALLKGSYCRHPHGHDALELSDIVLQRTDLTSLAELNIALIEHCCVRMELSAERFRSSELHVPGERATRVVAICEKLDASSYLSPPGARDYLQDDGFELLTRIKLEFDDYPAPAYPQQGNVSFVSHLSVLDVVANLGWKRLKQYIAPWHPN